MNELSVDTILAIRRRLSDTLLAAEDAFGGSEPLFPDKLESAVARQATGYGGERKYNTVAEVASTLFYGLAMNHAFENGNKRTALVSMLVFLQENKTVLVNTTEDELFDLVTAMARHALPVVEDAKKKRDELEVAYAAQWIDSRSRSLAIGDKHMEFRDFRRLLEDLGCVFEKPDRNFVKIRRGPFSFTMGYPKAKFTVDVKIIKDARRALRLDEVHGVDSAAFYGLEQRVDDFVNTYRNLMRRLASE